MMKLGRCNLRVAIGEVPSDQRKFVQNFMCSAQDSGTLY